MPSSHRADLTTLQQILGRSLIGRSEIRFKSGGYRTLVRVSGADFDRLTQGARHETFSHYVRPSGPSAAKITGPATSVHGGISAA